MRHGWALSAIRHPSRGSCASLLRLLALEVGGPLLASAAAKVPKSVAKKEASTCVDVLIFLLFVVGSDKNCIPSRYAILDLPLQKS